jgi:hypothetical protein
LENNDNDNAHRKTLMSNEISHTIDIERVPIGPTTETDINKLNHDDEGCNDDVNNTSRLLSNVQSDLHKDDTTKEQPVEAQKGNTEENPRKEDKESNENEYSSIDEDEDEEDTLNVERERYYTLDDYIKTFAKPSIIKNYLLILEDYQTNKGTLNHYVVKMFRCLQHLGYTLLFYQIFALGVFNQIITDTSIQEQKSDPSLIELRNFAMDIIRSFLQVLAQNPVVVAQEILGKRTKKEAELAFAATKELSQSTKTANNEQKENRLSEEDGGTVDFDLDEEIRKKQQLQEEEQQNNAQQQLARQSETSETLPAKKTKKKETSHSTEEPHIPEARHWTSEEIESLKSNYQLYSTLEEKKSQVFETVAFLLGENVTPCQVFHKLQELNLVCPDQHCPTQGS